LRNIHTQHGIPHTTTQKKISSVACFFAIKSRKVDNLNRFLKNVYSFFSFLFSKRSTTFSRLVSFGTFRQGHSDMSLNEFFFLLAFYDFSQLAHK